MRNRPIPELPASRSPFWAARSTPEQAAWAAAFPAASSCFCRASGSRIRSLAKTPARRLRHLLRHAERAEPVARPERLQPDDDRSVHQRFRPDVALRRSAQRRLAADQSLPGARRRHALRSAGGRGPRIAGQDGNGWTYLDPNYQRAREQRWRLEVQRQFGDKMVVSVGICRDVRQPRAPDQEAGRSPGAILEFREPPETTRSRRT